MRLRPSTSEAEPAMISAGAITSVETDSARLERAGERSNTRAKIGSSGCTL